MCSYADILLTLTVAAALCVAMLWPIERPPPAPAGGDKFVHLVAFAALAAPLAYTARFGLPPVFLFASVFGGLIELLQPSFNRAADWGDWVADVAGVAIEIAAAQACRRLRYRN